MSQRLLRSPAQLTSVDHPNLTTYENTLGIPPSRFTIVPNGVPDTSLRGCPFLSGKKPFTVGYVGRIFADKGWRRTADAIVRLVDAGENVRLILIGCGPDDDQARELSSRYPDNIQFRGNVPEARNTVMPEMDLLTLMSDYEAFPMVIIEAMSLGIPSAATAVGDIPLQIEHNLTGFVLPPSAEALAATIIQLIRNPDKLRATGEQARQRFEDRYTIDRIVHQYHRLYCEP
jgi:glycosyltransferase involved in cell wall biosynthesis